MPRLIPRNERGRLSEAGVGFDDGEPGPGEAVTDGEGVAPGVPADWENPSAGEKKTRTITRPFENVNLPSV